MMYNSRVRLFLVVIVFIAGIYLFIEGDTLFGSIAIALVSVYLWGFYKYRGSGNN